MQPLTAGLGVLALFASFFLGGLSAAAAQVTTPTARTPILLTATVASGAPATLVPAPLAPGVVPRTTSIPTPERSPIAATQTAAIATIAAADVTATARAGLP